MKRPRDDDTLGIGPLRKTHISQRDREEQCQESRNKVYQKTLKKLFDGAKNQVNREFIFHCFDAFHETFL